MKKKKNRLFKLIFGLFLLSFIVVYFSEITGYYEYQNNKKMVLTEEQRKKYEEDVKNNKQIDLNSYLVIEEMNYNNGLSRFTSKMSDNISKIVKSGIEYVFKSISKFVDE